MEPNMEGIMGLLLAGRKQGPLPASHNLVRGVVAPAAGWVHDDVLGEVNGLDAIHVPSNALLGDRAREVLVVKRLNA